MHPQVQYYLDKVVIRDGEKWIYENVDLADLELTELNFHDINVFGYFSCRRNKLKTLEGSPKSVASHFFAYHNCLESLEGSPDEIGGCFWVSNNRLKSLEGSPKIIKSYLHCTYNPLETLEGLNEVGDLIYLNKPLKNCDYFIQYSLMNKIVIQK